MKVDKVNKKASSDPDKVFELIHGIMHQFRAEQYRVVQDAFEGMTHMEGRLLGFLSRNPDATLSDLVGFMQRDKGQLARLVKSLEEQELITRRTDPKDRRSVRLALSPKGLAIHEALRKQVGKLSNQAVKGFSAAECRQLADLLAKVRENLDGTPKEA